MRLSSEDWNESPITELVQLLTRTMLAFVAASELRKVADLAT